LLTDSSKFENYTCDKKRSNRRLEEKEADGLFVKTVRKLPSAKMQLSPKGQRHEE
jgi:hypothetical protein